MGSSRISSCPSIFFVSFHENRNTEANSNAQTEYMLPHSEGPCSCLYFDRKDWHPRKTVDVLILLSTKNRLSGLVSTTFSVVYTGVYIFREAANKDMLEPQLGVYCRIVTDAWLTPWSRSIANFGSKLKARPCQVVPHYSLQIWCSPFIEIYVRLTSPDVTWNAKN